MEFSDFLFQGCFTDMGNCDTEIIDLCIRSKPSENEDIMKRKNPILYSRLEKKLIIGFADENFQAVIDNLKNLVLRLHRFRIELRILEGSLVANRDFEITKRLKNVFWYTKGFKGFDSSSVNASKKDLNFVKLKKMLLEKALQDCEASELESDYQAGTLHDDQLPDGLCLENSTVGVGLGVKTLIPIAKGVLFGPYEGHVLRSKEASGDAGYMWKVADEDEPSQYVDAKHPVHSNWLRYVNMALNEGQQNLVAFLCQNQVYYYAHKPILPGSELLVWYSELHAREMGQINGDELDLVPSSPSYELLPEGSLTPYACSKCKQQFVSSEFLEQHMKKRHSGLPPSSKRFRCPFCNYSTNTNANLVFHLRVHTGEKPYQCHVCGKAFIHSGNLSTHLRIHSEEQPHKCQVCGSQFGCGLTLRRHMKVHAHKAVHECPYCQKVFVRKTVLTIHIRTHTGHKPYHCSECDKSFSQLSALKTHAIFWHTGNFPHKCKECGMGFVYPSQLNRHIARSHQPA